VPYTTQAEMEARFGTRELIAITDRALPPSGAIDATTLTRALTDADAEIDSYLAARYKTPLASPGEIVKRVAADIARFRLYDDRATTEVRNRYNDAVAWLKDVAKGIVTLLDAAGSPAESAADEVLNAAPAATNKTVIFDRDNFHDRYIEPIPGASNL
jgi:phage gp36-like protein